MDQLRPAALASGNAGATAASPARCCSAGGAPSASHPMPTWAMIAVIVGWIVGWSGIGAWRMKTRDA